MTPPRVSGVTRNLEHLHGAGWFAQRLPAATSQGSQQPLGGAQGSPPAPILQGDVENLPKGSPSRAGLRPGVSSLQGLVGRPWSGSLKFWDLYSEASC